MSDMVNHPAHYTKGGIETIDFIEAKELGLHEGSVIQYITRWRHKNGIEDLKKARWYIDRLIQLEEKKRGSSAVANALADVERVAYWLRQSPGPTGEATRNDEFRRLSLEEEHEYIQSLNQLHFDERTPACPECLVPVELCEGHDDWSPENCAKPIIAEETNIFTGGGGVIDNLDDLITMIDSREMRSNAEHSLGYAPGWPYRKDRPTNPCGKGRCNHGK